MIRQVGLFKFLKNNYDSDEDLKDLEELVYKMRMSFLLISLLVCCHKRQIKMTALW